MEELLGNRLVTLGIGILVLGVGAVAIKRMVAKLSESEASRGSRLVDATLKKQGALAAAKVASENDLHQRAAQLFQQAGRAADAARALRKAEKWAEAGAAFEKLEDWASAAFCHRKSGDQRALARALAKDGAFVEAAKVAEQLGALVEAADLLLKAGKKAEAAELFKRTGNQARALELAAEARLEAGDYDGAGRAYVKLEQWDHALDAFRRGNLPELASKVLQRLARYIEAAELLAQSGRPGEAAAAFEMAQQFRLAAQHWQLAGEPERAIVALERDGDKIAAARLRFARGEHDRALALLKSVSETESQYPQSLRLRADLLRERGDLKGAFQALHGLLTLPGQPEKLAQWTREAVELAIELGQGRIGKALLERVAPTLGNAPSQAAWVEALRARLAKLPDAPEEMSLVGAVGARPTGRFQLGGAVETEATQTYTEGTVAYVGGEARAVAVKSFGVEFGTDGWPKGVPVTLARRYKGLSRLGQGGNGVVFRAEDALLNRVVVLKFMIDGSMPTEVARKYFDREVRMAASLSHPNIVHIYDMGHEDDVPWYSMEYIEGQPLSAHLPSGKPVSDKLFLMSVVEQVCAALDHAHGRGMIHRDIKPDNILVSNDGTAKLLDFGLARVLDDSFGELSVLAGTPYYMAPEQIDGSPVDHRADIYALGCILYRALVGRLPFQDGNIFVAHALEPVPDPHKFVPDLDRRIVVLLNRCLAKRPDNRPANCGQIKLELHEALFGAARVDTGLI